MKNKLLLSALKIAFLATFLPFFRLNAQIQVTETRPANMTVCMGDYTFSVKIKNTTASPVTSVNIMLDLPDHINYTGNLSNATEVDTSDPNEPIFGVANIAANDSVIVTYSAAASCGIVNTIVNNQTISNRYNFTYQWDSGTHSLLNVSPPSYNLLYANLSITTNNNSMTPGEIYQIGDVLKNGAGIGFRSFQISNGGNGAIDTVIIRITPEPEITYNPVTGFTGGNDGLPIGFTPGSIIELVIAGADFANCGALDGDPNLLEPGESIIINEDFTVDSCATGNTGYRVAWGCNAEYCNDVVGIGNATTDANINVQPGNPQFTMTSGNPLAFMNYCGKDGEMVFYFKNTGANSGDFATDLKVDILSYQADDANAGYFLPTSFELFDYSVNTSLLDGGLITAHAAIPINAPGSGSNPGYTIDFSGNTNSNILDDLDGDGFYDDLPAGDTLILKIKVRYISTAEFDNECPVQYIHRYGSPQIAWKTSCGDSRSTSVGTETYRYLTYSYTFEANTDKIEEPADFVEGTPEYFTFCTGNWNFSQTAYDCPVKEYRAVINLPVGYHLSSTDSTATWLSFYGDSLSLTALESGNQIIISGGGTSNTPNNSNVWTGCYTVQLELICPEIGVVTSPSTISWEMQYKCDTCDVFQRKACASQEVFNHVNTCPDSIGCRGIISRDFVVQRTTFGWTDETQTTLVTADSTGINLHAAYPFDEIQTSTSGEVIQAGFDNAFVEIAYHSSDTLFSFQDGQFQIYSNGILTGSCLATAPALTVASGIYTNLFQMPCYGSLNEGDSVVLVANWLVLNSVPLNPDGVDVYPVPYFRSKYIVDFNDTLGFCDSWGESFKLYSVKTFPKSFLDILPNACNEIAVKLYWQNHGGTNYNDFPNEFRNIGVLDNIIKFVIPPGYEYVDNSGHTFGYTTEEFDLANYYNEVFQAPISPVFSSNGDTITFDYDWKLLDKYGKNDFPSNNFPVFKFNLRPTCEHEDTIFTIMDFKYTNFAYADPQYHQLVNWPEVNQLPNLYDEANITWFHYQPNLQVSTGLAIADGYENTVQWDVTICNPQGSTPVGASDGVWLDIDNVIGNEGNIEITSVQQIGVGEFDFIPYNNGESAFVEVNMVGVNACRTFRVKASYTGCQEDAIDSLRLLTGWNCGGFPEPEQVETASCQVDTSYLMIRYKSANLQMAITEPSGTFEVCDTLNYEVVLTSSEPANMYDVDLFTSLPIGAQIVDAEYQYPYTLSPWLPLGPSNTSYDVTNPFGWDLSAIIPQFENGFVGSRFPDENEIRIRFGVVMGCDFNPAQDLVIYSDGITNCNDTVELNAHYSLPIAGFENLINYELTHAVSDTLDCTESNIISYIITNLDSASNVSGDSLRIELPSGFTFVPGSGTPSQPTVSGNELFWPVNVIPAGGTQTFTFQITSTTIFDCTSISLPAEIFNSEASNCALDCDVTASWQDTLSTMYCCDPCSVNADFMADTVCIGDTTCFDVTDNSMIGGGFTHQWNFGDGNFSNENEPCHVYAAAGTYDVTHIVVDSTGCSDTLTLAAVVSDFPHGSIELLGCNPHCEGDTVYLVVNGTYDSITWVELTDSVVVGTSDTLAVTSGGVYNAVLTNGECTGDCLAITISTQPLPEINIPDTMVCSINDSITLDAGSGYTSYGWNTGDTTQTITVGPGVYIVEVGERLPYGCCTCVGVDTVIVSVSDLTVALNDTTVCTGDSVLLNPVVTGGTPDYTYQWSTGESTPTIYVSTAGIYALAVTDAVGCTALDSMNLTLSSSANAEFSYLDSICAGDTSCFVALNSGIDSWSISNGVDTINFADTNTVCYSFTEPGTYTIEHILQSNCGTDTVTHTVYVHGIELDLSDTLVCSSADSVTLDAGSGFDSYLWNTGETTQTITVSTGTYWVQVGEQLGSSICYAVDTIHVDTNDLNVSITNDTTVCAGGTFRIYSTVSGGVTPYQFLWNTGAITTYLDVYEPGTYTLVVTDSMGCKDSASMTLDMIYPIDSQFEFDDTICVLDTACFEGLPVDADEIWQIYSENGDVIATFLDTSSICFQFASTGTFTVVHIVANECFRDSTANVITVIPPIEACIVMIGTNPFCEGDTVLLTINDPFDQVETIDWYKDSVFVGSFDTLIVTEPGTYTAMVEDENGCTSACMCIVLTQIPGEPVTLVDQVTICGNGDTETVTASGSFESYVWYLNGSVVGTSASITVNTSGVYHLEATSENGCVSRDSVSVIDGSLNVTLTRSVASACIGENVTLTATFDPNYTYQWQRFFLGSWQNLPGSGNQITTQIYKWGNNSFRVTVTDQVTGCQVTENITVMGIMGPCNSLIIAPNPTINDRSTVYYSLDGRGIQKATLEVLNMQGQLMKTHTLDTEETSIEIAFPGYAEGVYMIRLICDGEVMYTDRITIVR